MRKRALDLATGVGAAYPTKLLSDVGWDVVKVEPEQGDPLRKLSSRWGGGEGGAFAYVNHGKRGVRVDADTVSALAQQADVVVGDFSHQGRFESGLNALPLDELSPREVVCSVSAFGLSGPRSHWASCDLIMQAASGMMFITGEADQAPMQLPPYAAAMTGGVAAAAVIMAAVRAHRIDPEKETRMLDLAIVEAMVALTHGQVSRYFLKGEVARREQRVKQALRMAPSADGFIYCAPGAVANLAMDGIALLLDEPRLAEERFRSAEGRMQNWDEYLRLLLPPFAKKSSREWFAKAEELHLTFALVQTVDELFKCPQLKDRGFFQPVTAPNTRAALLPGRPFIMDGIDANFGNAPHQPGEHNEEVLREWL
ncbi:MAG: CoA transferase [Pseudomonadales bacterium]|jgi:crotonobetainyl-CoA:carnitine CoA-transferase CaiB-like acyl-CoA transferase|nr:CoA transferase [Pseudomonadales bacterium]MDP7358709.1 CoA transferase [Pseudomonadales bacterium]MDP7597439.1 CoA transferase [Pseudomonadales bacterium]HJN49249.1 CoA transferase [Pseudomonadales bacterium]|tara:strand:- start:8950 stop:10056 length:1107 start_codon:yes stop_codon:yes gene_type:complete